MDAKTGSQVTGMDNCMDGADIFWDYRQPI